MPEYDDCGNCGGEVTDDSDFCPHCGVLFEQAPVVACATHNGSGSCAVCVICGRYLCEICAVEVGGRFLCPEHESIKLVENYALVYQSRDVAEAATVRAMLTPSGQVASEDGEGNLDIPVEDDGGQFDVVDANLFTRGQLARLYVPIPRYLEAMEILKEWRESLKNP